MKLTEYMQKSKMVLDKNAPVLNIFSLYVLSLFNIINMLVEQSMNMQRNVSDMICPTEIVIDTHSLRGHPNMSTFSYQSVHPVHFFRPPPLPSVQTNIFGFHNMVFTQHNIYCATTKINPYFKPV